MTSVKLVAVAAAFLIGLSQMAGANTIRFGSVADFEPYNYLDDEGELQGFEAELAKLICTRAGLTCEWALAPWEDMVQSLMAYDFDVIMTGMQITAEREIYIDFTEEYFPADPSAFLAMEGAGYPSSVSVVGAQADSMQAGYVAEQGWALSTYTSPEDAVYALMANEISAFVGDQAYLEEVMLANPGVFSMPANGIVIGAGLGLGVREGSTVLKTALDLAIASLKEDGSLDTLIGAWFAGRDPNYRGAE